MATGNKTSFLYNFLISPQFRLWRHVLLILIVIPISISQALYTFEENIYDLNNYIYIVGFITMVLYLLIIYLNLYILVPIYLFKKAYTNYFIGLSLLVVALVLGMYAIEYFTVKVLNLSPNSFSIFYPGNSFCLDFFYSFSVDFICMVGISMTALLKSWMINDQRIQELQKGQIQSEVEQLKDQITPVFLFSILNQSSVLAKSDAPKSSDMLMKLSDILRYQLYDCSRDKVLLSSEIVFITNYLKLGKLYNNDLDFDIIVSGDTNRIFIPPLLFVPFVQHAINNISKDILVTYSFEVALDKIQFFYTRSGNVEKDLLNDKAFDNIKRRLNLVLLGKYELKMIGDNKILLQI